MPSIVRKIGTFLPVVPTFLPEGKHYLRPESRVLGGQDEVFLLILPQQDSFLILPQPDSFLILPQPDDSFLILPQQDSFF